MPTLRNDSPKPPKMVILFFNGFPLFVYPAIAKRLGYKPGQRVDDENAFIKLVHENAHHYTLISLAKASSLN